MLENWQIEAVRNGYKNAAWQEIRDDRGRHRRNKSLAAQETADLLQILLEEKIAAEDAEQSPAEWSKSQEPKKWPLTAAEKKQREEARLERETQGGRFLPRPKEPESPYKNQTEYEQARRMNRAEYKAFLASQKPPRD